MNRTLGATALAVALGLGLAALTPLTAQAADSGQITGRVHSDDGVVVSGITVQAIVDGAVVKSATSDRSGAYKLRGLAEGTYILRYSDREHRYLAEYYGDVATADVATPIVLHDGEKRTGTTDSLTRASRITGSVLVNTTPADPALGAIEGRLIDSKGQVVARQLAAPTFTFTDLPADDYTIYFCTPNDDQSWVTCAYFGQTPDDGKIVISVAAGTGHTGLSQNLAIKPGVVLPTIVTAKITPATVRYGTSLTLRVTARSYGDLSRATVSIQHHNRLVETTSIVKGKASFRLSSKAWAHSKKPKLVKVRLNATDLTLKNSTAASFRIR